MSTLVIVLRVAALFCFAAPLLLRASGRRAHSTASPQQRGAGRGPVVANVVASGAFFVALLAFPGSSEGPTALLLALSGGLLAAAGAGLVLKSRAALGPAWSFAPLADRATGLITAGPYRRVRHPIYLGLTLLATGNALAFSSGPALVVVLSGIVPTFAWRAHAEERVLARTFGDRYRRYQSQTKMILPHVL